MECRSEISMKGVLWFLMWFCWPMLSTSSAAEPSVRVGQAQNCSGFHWLAWNLEGLSQPHVVWRMSGPQTASLHLLDYLDIDGTGEAVHFPQQSWNQGGLARTHSSHHCHQTTRINVQGHTEGNTNRRAFFKKYNYKLSTAERSPRTRLGNRCTHLHTISQNELIMAAIRPAADC